MLATFGAGLSRLFLQLPIVTKILLVFLLFLIIPFAIFGMISMQGTRAVIYEQIGNYNEKMMAQANVIFQNKLQLIEDASLQLLSDVPLQKILSQPGPVETNPEQFTNQSLQIEGALLHFTQRTGLKRVTLYHDKTHLIVPFNYKFESLDTASQQQWFSHVAAANGTSVWYSDIPSWENNPQRMVLTMVRPLKNIYTNRVIGYMKVEIPASYFTEILNQTLVLKTGVNLLLNSQHAIISRTENPELNNWIDQQGIAPTLPQNTSNVFQEWKPDVSMPTYLVFHKRLNDQLTLVNLIQKQEVLRPTDMIQTRDAIIFSLAILLALFLMFFLHTMFVRPLHRLTKLMRYFEKGDLTVDIPYVRRPDEIGYIFRGFHEMTSNLRRLINEVYLERLHKQEAEIRALQSQINPHLLYNTLDSINLLAIKNKVPAIQQMIGALSKFFRISLSKGKDIITIREEVEHARAYLTLQKYRLNHELAVSIEIEDAILDCETNKCVLQPIIENSLFHGLSNQANGTLKIRGFSSGEHDVCLEVSDNGKGFPPGKWAEILGSRGEGHHGMWNVHQRIQLVYGEQYGITMPVTHTRGSLVRILFPKQRGRSAVNDDEIM